MLDVYWTFAESCKHPIRVAYISQRCEPTGKQLDHWQVYGINHDCTHKWESK